MWGPGGKKGDRVSFFLRPFLYSIEGPVPAGRHHAQVSLGFFLFFKKKELNKNKQKPVWLWLRQLPKASFSQCPIYQPLPFISSPKPSLGLSLKPLPSSSLLYKSSVCGVGWRAGCKAGTCSLLEIIKIYAGVCKHTLLNHGVSPPRWYI